MIEVDLPGDSCAKCGSRGRCAESSEGIFGVRLMKRETQFAFAHTVEALPLEQVGVACLVALTTPKGAG